MAVHQCKVIPGRIPGFSDSTQDNFAVYSLSGLVNYTVNNTTFMEGSWGWNFHHQEGCSITGGDPNWCITGDAVNPSANRLTAGFGGIPYLFPDATLLDQSTISAPTGLHVENPANNSLSPMSPSP